MTQSFLNRYGNLTRTFGIDSHIFFGKENPKKRLLRNVKPFAGSRRVVAKKFQWFSAILQKVQIKTRKTITAEAAVKTITRQLIEDWVQCKKCMLWVHENCTEYEDMCSNCSTKKNKDLKDCKGKGKDKKTKGHLPRSPMAITPGYSGRDGQSWFFLNS